MTTYHAWHETWDAIRDGRDAVLIHPSLLAADLTRIGEEVEGIAEDADALHFDVMDGVFVPNISYGLPVLEAVSKRKLLPNDVHLMIADASRYVEAFADAGADVLTVHVEASPHLHRTVQQIKDRGMRAAAVLNPGTSLHQLDAILPDLDMVLIMSVNPGFGGQQFIPSSLAKIRALRTMTEGLERRPLIEVDGGVSETNAAALAEAGADIFVAGSAVFKRENPAAAIRAIRREAMKGLAARRDGRAQ